jgi:hypothetical protein
MGEGSVAGAIKGAVEAFGGKGVTITPNSKSTNIHNCENCPWKFHEREWVALTAAMLGFSRWNWLAAKIVLTIAFEYNGCDVNNARVRVSEKTFNKWFNDSARYDIKVSGEVSKLLGESGCPDCCGRSACVEFDVDIDRSCDWVRTKTYSWRLRICGDGSVAIF